MKDKDSKVIIKNKAIKYLRIYLNKNKFNTIFFVSIKLILKF